MEMEMERSSSSSMSQRVIQQAKEELEMLEAQHPNRFHSLKLDLKTFIFFHSQNRFLINSNSNRNSNINASSSSSPSSSHPPHHQMPSSTSSSVTTQASSNSSRKRKRGVFDDGDRVDEVLKRAQVCLQRIEDLKTNFFCSSHGGFQERDVMEKP